MIDFAKRSYKKELLDTVDIPFEDTLQTMKELNIINSYLGGHAITLKGFKNLLQQKKEAFVCEIGCGGGDNLKVIGKWCNRKNLKIKLTGIDINPDCKTVINNPSIQFISSDYKQINFKEKPDIIFSSLFCHHFTDEELIEVMHWMKENSNLGFFINDLHRHQIAYHFIKFVTKLFSKSYLVKNDGPLSVLRGFKKNEWVDILNKSEIKNYTIQWNWAFRHLIIVHNEQ